MSSPTMSRDATLAVQFDKATLGLTVAVMREQILANIVPMFQVPLPALHAVPGLHSYQPTTYNVVLSEHEHPRIPLLQYEANVICCDSDGVRIVLHGKKEATIWAAYRTLVRITMKEVARQMSGGHAVQGSEMSDDSSDDGYEKRDSGVSMRQAKSVRVLGLHGMDQ